MEATGRDIYYYLGNYFSFASDEGRACFVYFSLMHNASRLPNFEVPLEHILRAYRTLRANPDDFGEPGKNTGLAIAGDLALLAGLPGRAINAYLAAGLIDDAVKVAGKYEDAEGLLPLLNTA